MDKPDFQRWLSARATDRGLDWPPLAIDGVIGDRTLELFDAVMRKRDAPAVNAADLIAFSIRLSCSVAHIAAIAAVETNGSGFDDLGRPKILFERHKFWALTGGRHGKSGISSPVPGGYGLSSAQWARLRSAMRRDPEAAIASASWGAFQVMGYQANGFGGKTVGACNLDYPSPAAMAFTMVLSEADHYEALARYIEKNGLADELRAGGRSEISWTPFALRYNGSRQDAHDYDGRLAQAYRRAVR